MVKNFVRRESYITILGWMVTDLNLKGNELLVYAIIYGFSQTEDQRFTGSHSYLAEWTNTTKKNIRNCISSLIERGYIEKTEEYRNNVKFCEYKAIPINFEKDK